MIYKRHLNETYKTLSGLLEEIYALEQELLSRDGEISQLKDYIADLEETTARECLGGDIAKGMETDLPPEKRPPVKAAKSRIKAASKLFEKNFDQFGNPTTELGSKLSKRYGGL